MKTNITLALKPLLILPLSYLLLSCNSTPECESPEQISYTPTVANLIEIHCFKCHAQDVYKEKASRIKIYTYETLKQMGESGQLIGSITHSQGYIPMPYRKGVKIDSCDIEIIKKWVATGMVK